MVASHRRVAQQPDPHQVCGQTGLSRLVCYHCPLPGDEPAPLPVTVVARESQVRAITERARERLLRKGEWYPAVYAGECITCRRRYVVGEPVRFLYGRTSRDMSTQAWCCERLPADERRRILGGQGIVVDPGVEERKRGGFFR